MLITTITLERKLIGNGATYGHLTVKTMNHGSFKFTTIESTQHQIQKGKYRIDYTHSPRFNRKTHELRNVKGRTGIRIHSGNYSSDFTGCIGLGIYNELDEIPIQIWHSKKSVEIFESLIYNEKPIINII
jgi:hypothetical protein